MILLGKMSLDGEERYDGALHLLAQESEGILSKRKRDANYRNKLKISLWGLDSVLPPPGRDVERNYNRILEDAFALITHLESRLSVMLSQARNRCQSFKINYALLTLTMTRAAYSKTLTETWVSDGEECSLKSVEEYIQIRAREYFSELVPAQCLKNEQDWESNGDKKPLEVTLTSRKTGASWKPYYEGDEIDVSLDSSCTTSYGPETPIGNYAIDFSLKKSNGDPKEGHPPVISTPKKSIEPLSHMLAHRPFKSKKQLAVSMCTPETAVYATPKSSSRAPGYVTRSASKGKVCQGKKRLNFSNVNEDSSFPNIKRKRSDELLHIEESYPLRTGKRRRGRGRGKGRGRYNRRKKYDFISSDIEGKIWDGKSPLFEKITKKENGTKLTEKQNSQNVPCAPSWQEKKENIPPNDQRRTLMPATSSDLLPTLPFILNTNISSPGTTELVINELEEIGICSPSSGKLFTMDKNSGVSSGDSSFIPGILSPQNGGINKDTEDNGVHLECGDAFYPLSKLASVLFEQDASSSNAMEESSYLQVSNGKNYEDHTFISPLPRLGVSYNVLCAPRKARRLTGMQASPHCRRNLTRTFQTASPRPSCVKWHDTPPDSPWRREQMLPQMEFDSD